MKKRYLEGGGMSSSIQLREERDVKFDPAYASGSDNDCQKKVLR